MVHGFVVQSGGALILSSQPGAGTSVELWLPRTTDPVPDVVALPVVTRAASPSGRGPRILLVDDDRLVVAGTIGMLEELGHESVRTAGSGEAALAVLREDGPFDLLLTDHVMPGMSGAALASRARELYPDLSIVIASGFAELDALAGVPWPRLRKPYSLNDLAAVLAAFEPAGLDGQTGRASSSPARKSPCNTVISGLDPVICRRTASDAQSPARPHTCNESLIRPYAIRAATADFHSPWNGIGFIR